MASTAFEKGIHERERERFFFLRSQILSFLSKRLSQTQTFEKEGQI
jgi:hypothetical protein